MPRPQRAARHAVSAHAASRSSAAAPHAGAGSGLPRNGRRCSTICTRSDSRDKAPAEVYATLIDEGVYLCSIRTMHRILAENGELKERRNQLRHPQYKKPELLATGPNQVWTWDITKLLGPAKWTYFHLYVILDIFSRYVVGWMVAPRETAELAKRLIAETCAKQGIDRGHLTIHADRGTSMTSKPVALLLADLGVTKTHSRPHVSDDNPYSESQFKTLKYMPEFPERFGSIEDARAFCQRFFPVVQHRASSQRDRPADPGDAALRHGWGGDRAAATGARCGLCRNPERFTHARPKASAPAHSGLDQPTNPGRATEEKSTLNSDATCLKLVDTFRGRDI
jgi:putative transposase